MGSDGKYKTHLIKNLTNKETKYMPSISSISDLSIGGMNRMWSRRLNGGVRGGAVIPEEGDEFKYTSETFGFINKDYDGNIAIDEESLIPRPNRTESLSSSDNFATRSEFERYKSKAKDHYKKVYRKKYNKFKDIVKDAQVASSLEDRDRVTKAALTGLGFWTAYNKALKGGLKRKGKVQQRESLSKQISDNCYEVDTKGFCPRCKYNHVKDCEETCGSKLVNGLDVVVYRSKSGKVIDSFRVNLDPTSVNKGLINKIDISIRSNRSGRMDVYDLSRKSVEANVVIKPPTLEDQHAPVHRVINGPENSFKVNKGEFSKKAGHTDHGHKSKPCGQDDLNFNKGQKVCPKHVNTKNGNNLKECHGSMNCVGHNPPNCGDKETKEVPLGKCSNIWTFPQPSSGWPLDKHVAHLNDNHTNVYYGMSPNDSNSLALLDVKTPGNIVSGEGSVKEVAGKKHCENTQENKVYVPSKEVIESLYFKQQLNLSSESDFGGDDGTALHRPIDYYSESYANLELESLLELMNGNTKLHGFKINNRGVNVPLFLNIGTVDSVYSGQGFVTSTSVGLFKISVVEPIEPKLSLGNKVANYVGINNFKNPSCKCSKLSSSLAINKLCPKNREVFNSILNTFADYTGIPWINPMKTYDRPGKIATGNYVKNSWETNVCDFHKNLFNQNVDRTRFGKDLFCQLKYMNSVTTETPMSLKTDSFANGSNVSSFFNGFHEQLLCVGESRNMSRLELLNNHRFTFIIRRVKGSKYGRNFTILNTTSGQHLCIDLLTHELRFEEECKFSKFLVPAIFKIIPLRDIVEAVSNGVFQCFKPVFKRNASGKVSSVIQEPHVKHVPRYLTPMSTTDQFVKVVS